MTRPLLLSDRLSPSVEAWLAKGARLAERTERMMAEAPTTTELEDAMISESQAQDARGKGEVARRHGQPEGANPHIGPLADAWMDGWLAVAADLDRLALFDALGTYEQVKATCDDHKRMVRERDAGAWVSVEERLPEVGVAVLAWRTLGRVEVVRLDKGGWWYGADWYQREPASVTHWRRIVPPVPR